ncbi:hypothetical protein DSO57_1035302 [Entomophthora muscae]|uniref:Uncharacterized protein n=1 Tax=Entomophthora muscae TaxID=34485 RepID=A0ACC2U8L5_9FUNG|nr:hypothetical protein DSO57_1035302 [Entomophthora muscae]
MKFTLAGILSGAVSLYNHLDLPSSPGSSSEDNEPVSTPVLGGASSSQAPRNNEVPANLVLTEAAIPANQPIFLLDESHFNIVSQEASEAVEPIVTPVYEDATHGQPPKNNQEVPPELVPTEAATPAKRPRVLHDNVSLEKDLQEATTAAGRLRQDVIDQQSGPLLDLLNECVPNNWSAKKRKLDQILIQLNTDRTTQCLNDPPHNLPNAVTLRQPSLVPPRFFSTMPSECQ